MGVVGHHEKEKEAKQAYPRQEYVGGQESVHGADIQYRRGYVHDAAIQAGMYMVLLTGRSM